MFDRCTSTVFVDRYSIEAMALLVRPAAALSATCRSASVSTAPSDHGVNSASSRCARAAHSELPSSSNVVAASLSDAVAASAALAVKPDGTSLYVADGKARCAGKRTLSTTSSFARTTAVVAPLRFPSPFRSILCPEFGFLCAIAKGCRVGLDATGGPFRLVSSAGACRVAGESAADLRPGPQA